VQKGRLRGIGGAQPLLEARLAESGASVFSLTAMP